MGDFLDYYKKIEQNNAMNEEEQLALHKKHKQMTAIRHKLDDDDDYYNGEMGINEGKRIYKQPVRPIKPASRPRPIEPAIVPPPAPKPTVINPPEPIQPSQPARPDNYDPFDSLATDTPIVPRRKKGHSMDESVNPALKEAYSMMDEMQKKIETMFFRYGMAGLEKINECMEDVFEDIVNPKPVREIQYIEKPAPAIKPKKKVVKRPTTIKETAEKSETITETKTATIKKVTPEKIQQAFEDINNSFDIAQLGTSLTEEAKQSNSDPNSIGAKRLQQVQANAKILEKSIQKKDENVSQAEDESYVQPEEFDIVDDDVVIDPIAEAKDYTGEDTADTSTITDITPDEK